MTSSDCGVVVFDYPAFIMQYPEFASVTQPMMQIYFNRVTIGGLVDNTPTSPMQDLCQRALLLNMATAHVAVLAGALAANGTPPPTGRVSSATQGSVSVNLELNLKGGTGAAYWSQTPYGLEYYMSTLKFRTAVYIPPPACGVPTVPFFNRFGLGVIRRG